MIVRSPASVWLLLLSLFLPLDSQVSGQLSKEETAESRHLTQYILQRLLGQSGVESDSRSRAAAEERIFSDGTSASIVYPQYAAESPIKRYLDEAKEQIDVINFRRPRGRRGYVRRVRQNPNIAIDAADDLAFSDSSDDTVKKKKTPSSRGSSGSASEQVPVKLAFPGNDFEGTRQTTSGSCTNCVPDGNSASPNRWTMPLQRLGSKQYYLGVFFKANWYKAEQYCRFHGMHLASINSAEEQRDLQEHIQAYGMGHEHFWTSGTDQAEEGKFFWMSTGRPITYSNWNAGEPNNFEYEDGEQEHCLEMWDRDGKGLGWNDTPCSFQTFFICEAQS